MVVFIHLALLSTDSIPGRCDVTVKQVIISYIFLSKLQEHLENKQESFGWTPMKTLNTEGLLNTA